MIPGEYQLREEPVKLNVGRKTKRLLVANTGDRPIQVGSHFHFFEVNRALRFAREEAFGYRLNIPSGTAVRFEPGEEKEVELVSFPEKAAIYGLNSLTQGPLHLSEVRQEALERAKARGFIKSESQSGL